MIWNMFEGLRTIIYPSKDLASDKAFWSDLLGKPYFDQPFYVGFNIGPGYELGLDPNGETEGLKGPVVYWGVKDIDITVKTLKTKGLELLGPIQNHGDGIKTANFFDNNGYQFGVIENPHLQRNLPHL